GVQSSKTQGIWRSLLSGPLAGRPVRAVMFSHHHPDHVGSVAWLARETGAEIWATRTAWLMARMLTLDEQDRPTPEALRFYRQTGMAEAVYQERATSRPFNFCDAVGLLPLGYRRIADGDVLSLGGRDWHVLTGHGHAPEQATLWCAEAGLCLTADQILPGISPNLGVYPTEPEADPVGPWLTSCSRLQEYARTNAPESLLALPGHKLPFQGVDLRLAQLIDNHHQALERLQDFLSTPQVAVACFQCLFKREIKPSEFGLALALRRLIQQAAERGGFRYQVGIPMTVDGLPISIEQQIYRITEESLNNIVRHAQAKRVELVLEHNSRQILLRIIDDGVGFDPIAEKNGHFGLVGMRERTELIQGTLDVISQPDRGTEIRIKIPI
ncbi:MAG: MBL fold metallo-hydrolase, partial [Chloroflexota bacterium]